MLLIIEMESSTSFVDVRGSYQCLFRAVTVASTMAGFLARHYSTAVLKGYYQSHHRMDEPSSNLSFSPPPPFQSPFATSQSSPLPASSSSYPDPVTSSSPPSASGAPPSTASTDSPSPAATQLKGLNE